MNLKPPTDLKLAAQIARTWDRASEDASRVYYARPVLQMSDYAERRRLGAVAERERQAEAARINAEVERAAAEHQARLKARDEAMLRVLQETPWK